MLTTSDSDGEIQRAMRAGASAYLLESMPKDYWPWCDREEGRRPR